MMLSRYPIKVAVLGLEFAGIVQTDAVVAEAAILHNRKKEALALAVKAGSTVKCFSPIAEPHPWYLAQQRHSTISYSPSSSSQSCVFGLMLSHFFVSGQIHL
ncbi:hypothetical protein DD237_001283 [Peronospora effusa]|uniref:Uncharacterized protein n=1 Tax=Peronospora effusa TaxID=542832 RepID=A0A3R7XK64_9STRA|nr:hypothetical protein DD237_001283 [Peronospora effusa]